MNAPDRAAVMHEAASDRASGGPAGPWLVFDDRWIADHGIGRVAREWLWFGSGWRSLRVGPRPASPADPIWLAARLRYAGLPFISPGYNAPIASRQSFFMTVHDLCYIDAARHTGALRRLYYGTVVRRRCDAAHGGGHGVGDFSRAARRRLETAIQSCSLGHARRVWRLRSRGTEGPAAHFSRPYVLGSGLRQPVQEHEAGRRHFHVPRTLDFKRALQRLAASSDRGLPDNAEVFAMIASRRLAIGLDPSSRGSVNEDRSLYAWLKTPRAQARKDIMLHGRPLRQKQVPFAHRVLRRPPRWIAIVRARHCPCDLRSSGRSMTAPESARGIGIDTPAVTTPRVDAVPMVTIVTVCFGAARTLPRTLDSLRLQRDPRLEYVVIDGGSRDGAVALLKSSADVVGRYLSESDRGLYDAMNKGAAMACGCFLWFVNADDWLEAGAVEAVLEALERCGDEEILLTGDTRRVDASGRPIARSRPEVEDAPISVLLPFLTSGALLDGLVPESYINKTGFESRKPR